jgi:hypothetical protein
MRNAQETSMDLTGYDYKRRMAEKKVAEKNVPEKNISVQPAPRPALAPSSELTDEAIRLLDSLAHKCPMSELPARFPRVLNRLAAVWSQPALAERYFVELLLDSRGSRLGFPPEVLSELLALRSCNAVRIFPGNIDPWQEMHLR